MISIVAISIVLQFCEASLPIYESKVVQTSYGFTGSFKRTSGNGPFPPDSSFISFDIYCQTKDRIHIRFYDPSKKYMEITNVLQISEVTKAASQTNYVFEFPDNGGIIIKRKDSGDVIFDTHTQRFEHPLMFEQEYISLTTTTGRNPVIYGLGSRRSRYALKYPFNYTIHNQDRGTPPDDQNLYGSHPFHVEVRPNGKAHGIFFFNSAPMQIELQNGWMTYRAMAGEMLDFYIFLGPTQKDVIKQYTDVIGKPALVPQWATGFHQCAWGYKSIADARNVVENYEKYNLPLDVMWADIDYMDEKKLFTTDPVNFPKTQFAQFISEIKEKKGIRYVAIVDPGVKVESGYEPYESLASSGYYLRNRTAQPYIGEVWPGRTIFPDFFSTGGGSWWASRITKFVKDLHLDGIWNDMNEIANFCDGECDGDSGKTKYAWTPRELDQHGVQPDAVTAAGPYYLTHSLYAHMENIHTIKGLKAVNSNTRPFVLTRASFAGSGKNNFLWLGDNDAKWEDLRDSISGILSSGLFGMPFTGCDVGGFNGDTNAELLTRWTATGAFLYPFFRDHRSENTISQEMYAFGEPYTSYNRRFLQERQKIQSYFYTLMLQSHDEGVPIIRSLSMEFPGDSNCLKIDSQAMLGSALLVSPVLEPGAKKATGCYFPKARWYDYWTGAEDKRVEVSAEEENSNESSEFRELNGVGVDLPADLDTIPVHIRGGAIFTKQNHVAQRLMKMKDTPFTVVAALDYDDCAFGYLSVDDGERVDANGNCKKSTLRFQVSRRGDGRKGGRLSVTVAEVGFNSVHELEEIRILGVAEEPSKIHFSDQRAAGFEYDREKKILIVRKARGGDPREWMLLKEFELLW
ncbi:alpha-glucosidase [Monocercomonoides exilis]|uniref:alpha-glucosidase n=1 Tax=Monocercomonoides exilis TaxID=2049356 RepID=UPI003559ED14|nr:alpha-glucosidase [Monocercomonoides exilis]|eukprot:MONOS_2917.1-p1 / transcript=MONOS_2917.1 / gene=MONOS_2917 / organism=Monocercomonoides_exilis_PA203 / gene_product=alpha-glucosidase / transcript_product=alpha-glucosidase / location=Mono_scaffold00064:1206-3773(+) / protein_length=856 / sequence_SO=supercontig / SO=protein_coding / is_pseudo=false